MNWLIRIIQTLVLCFFMGCFIIPSVGHTQDYKRVLLLNSYSLDIKWTRVLTQRVITRLKKAKKDIKLTVEFMDTKNFYSQKYYTLLKEEFELKYKNVPFDVIITADDNAVNFVLEHRQELFKETPLVFCGVNNPNILHQPNFTNMTGVLEAPDVIGTVKAALALQPDLKTIYFVMDDTTTGQLMRSSSQEIAQSFKNHLSVEWLDNMSLKMLKKTLSRLPDRSAVVVTSFTHDVLNNHFSFSDGIKQLSSYSRVPIYGVWDFYLGYGIVGGMLTSGDIQGLMAAEMALSILDGKKPKDIPVVTQKVNRYMFDYAQLEKYDLNPDRIPPNSVLINVPKTIYSEYRKEALVFLGLMVSLVIIIIVLLGSIRGRKRAEHELEQVNDYQELLIEERTKELTARSRELEIANYELTKLDELKTAVLNTVSHDLRTPLTSVLGFCKIIHRDFNKYFFPIMGAHDLVAKGERIRTNLDIIEKEGKRLTRLINDFLDLSKIESGSVVWNDVFLDIKKTILDAKPILDGFLVDKPVSLKLIFEDDLPKIKVDPDRILQILTNLVGNAAKFSSDGEICIIAGKTENDCVKIAVKDMGVGIPENQIGQIFDKFYQVSKNEIDIDEVSRGSGMGLAITKRIVEHYNGTISVESVVGKGSTFTFILPTIPE